MGNEIIIEVRADDKTGAGFASAKRGANKTASDIEGELQAAGEKGGKKLGDGVKSEVEKAGTPAGKNLGQRIMGGLNGAMPASAFGQIALVGGVAMAPALGAAIAGGIIGGVGIGGVIGGVMLASKDPRVATAGQSLSKNLMSALQVDAKPFIGPVLTGITTLQSAFETKLRPSIQGIFKNSAAFVAPLTDGITRMLDGILRGAEKLTSRAGPVIAAFSGAFDTLGEAIGQVFDTVSGDADGAAQGITDLADGAGALVKGLGYLIRGLTEVDGWLHVVANSVVEAGRAIGVFNEAQSTMGTFAKHTAGEMGQLTDAAKAQEDAFKSLAAEMRAQTDPLFAMIKGQRDVAKAQLAYNDALKKHGPKSREAKEALDLLGEAAFGLNSKVGAVSGSMNGKLTPAMRTALHNAGLSKTQMNRLEKSLKDAAAAAHRWEGSFKQTYITSFKMFGKPYSAAGIASGNVGGLASGGIKGAANGSTPSGLTWVGEQGPELMSIPAGTRVHSNPDSMRMAGGGGGGKLDITLHAAQSATRDLVSLLMQAMRLEIRSQGGNVQQVLGVVGR